MNYFIYKFYIRLHKQRTIAEDHIFVPLYLHKMSTEIEN